VIKNAADILRYLFPKKSKELLNWISKNDKNLK